tara:strand:+ start:426 stop:620 length:195 start_codon:yes stop_codon:yes gene_type:complete
MDESKINRIINYIREEVPTNAISNGEIAGDFEHTGDDPPIKKKKKKKKKYAYLKTRHSRKTWMP